MTAPHWCKPVIGVGDGEGAGVGVGDGVAADEFCELSDCEDAGAGGRSRKNANNKNHKIARAAKPLPGGGVPCVSRFGLILVKFTEVCRKEGLEPFGIPGSENPEIPWQAFLVSGFEDRNTLRTY